MPSTCTCLSRRLPKVTCCCSVAQLCPTLCDPIECSTPDFPVLQHLLEFAQTHVHWAGDAMQPSHPLLSSVKRWYQDHYKTVTLTRCDTVYTLVLGGDKEYPRCQWGAGTSFQSCACGFSRMWLFATSWTVALQAPLSLGFCWQEYRSGLPFPSPEDLPDPGIKAHVSCIDRRILYHWVTMKACGYYRHYEIQRSINIKIKINNQK